MFPSDRPLTGVEKDLVTMDSDQYLSRFGIRHYIHDAILQLAETKDPKPVDSLRQYFHNATRGTHILRRGYSAVIATQYNRCSFAALFQKTLVNFSAAASGEDVAVMSAEYTVFEYVQFGHMLCTDFPQSLMEEVFGAGVFPTPLGNTHNCTTCKAPRFTLLLLVYLFYKEYLEDIKALREMNGEDFFVVHAGNGSSLCGTETLRMVRTSQGSTPSSPLSWRPSYASKSHASWEVVPKDFTLQFPSSEMLSCTLQEMAKERCAREAIGVVSSEEDCRLFLQCFALCPLVLQHIRKSFPHLFENWVH
eukprot:PhF_6_TR28111/c2_g1_i1/m.41564